MLYQDTSSHVQSYLVPSNHNYITMFEQAFTSRTCLIAIFCETFKTVSNLLPKTLLKRVRCEVSPLVERCLLEAAEVNMVKLFVFLKHCCALYFASLSAHSMRQLNHLLGLVSLHTHIIDVQISVLVFRGQKGNFLCRGAPQPSLEHYPSPLTVFFRETQKGL